MKKYILIYEKGTPPQSEEEGKMVMQEWMTWFGKLGANMVDGGFPFMDKAMAIDGTMTEPTKLSQLSGYSIISAENYEAALTVAMDCPAIKSGSIINVYEEMPVMGM